MTKREFFEKVIAMAGNNTEMVNFAIEQIALLDKKNDSAKAKRIAKASENAPIENGIVEYLTNHKVALANELATTCDVSTSKIVAVAKKMVDNGTIKVAKVKIAKVGERNQYSLM